MESIKKKENQNSESRTDTQQGNNKTSDQILNYICIKCKETVQLNNILIICPNCNGRIFRKEKTTAILRIPAK